MDDVNRMYNNGEGINKNVNLLDNYYEGINKQMNTITKI